MRPGTHSSCCCRVDLASLSISLVFLNHLLRLKDWQDEDIKVMLNPLRSFLVDLINTIFYAVKGAEHSFAHAPHLNPRLVGLGAALFARRLV